MQEDQNKIIVISDEEIDQKDNVILSLHDSNPEQTWNEPSLAVELDPLIDVKEDKAKTENHDKQIELEDLLMQEDN